MNVTAGTVCGLASARKVVCCCRICWIFCGSSFFTVAALGLAAVVELVCVVTDGAALADGAVAGAIVALVAGVIVAPAAGVLPGANVVGVVATVGAGVVATVGAGAVVVFAAAGLDFAFVFGVEAAVALGDVLASASGFFEFLLFRREFFVTSGVALGAPVVAGSSAFVFGAVAAGVFWFFVFLSGLGASEVGGGVMVCA